MKEKKQLGDEQIISEIALNERLVKHPSLGKVKLCMPTLDIQRKIENSTRAKRKWLKEAKDRIPDPEAPDGFKYVQAFKSREALEREYQELGWWRQEDQDKMDDLSGQHVNYLTELELLGFESEDSIITELQEYREKLYKMFDADLTDEIKSAIITLTVPGVSGQEREESVVRDNANSTEIDDILDEISVLQRQFIAYIGLARTHAELLVLQGEYSSLFSDSWQEQLQYYVRLAQVFHCAQNAETGKSLWGSIEDIEHEKNIESVRWLFAELSSFWQGLSDDARQKLAKYSFTDLRSTEESSTEESQEVIPPSPDGDLQVKPQETSLEVTDIAAQSPKVS